MELSEKWLRTFEREGFACVYEWVDAPNTVYPAHEHTGKVSIFVTDGSCTFDFDGKKREIQAGERFDVPVRMKHSAVVGEQGWSVVVGEEIVGDS